MFEGIITPIITPFHRNESQSIHYEATQKLIDHLIQKGVRGIFILGSNGEFHVLSKEEKLAFAKEVIRMVDKRVPVYVGTGCCSTKETIELSKEMEVLRADALSIVCPYFLKPSDEEIYEHFKEIAQSVKIPIVLYNIPKATGCNITPEVVDRLADIGNIKAIKDSSGNEDNLIGYCNVSKTKDLKVLIGSDSKISYGYQLGASGAVAGTSNVITDCIVNLDKALRENNQKLANKLQKDIDVLRGVLPLGTVPSVMKRACELAHICEAGPARKPVRECSKSTDEKIVEMLEYYHLLD